MRRGPFWRSGVTMTSSGIIAPFFFCSPLKRPQSSILLIMQRAIFPIARVLRPQTVQAVSCVSWNATRSLPARGPTGATRSRPPFRMASSSASQPSPIRFSEGEDTEQVTTGLNSVRQRGWQLDADGMGITKTYYFKSYFKAVVRSFCPFD